MSWWVNIQWSDFQSTSVLMGKNSLGKSPPSSNNDQKFILIFGSKFELAKWAWFLEKILLSLHYFLNDATTLVFALVLRSFKSRTWSSKWVSLCWVVGCHLYLLTKSTIKPTLRLRRSQYEPLLARRLAHGGLWSLQTWWCLSTPWQTLRIDRAVPNSQTAHFQGCLLTDKDRPWKWISARKPLK